MPKQMFQKCSFRRRRKRAVSSIIGGLFALAIIILGVSSILYVTNLENSLHVSSNGAALIDTQKNEENLALNDLVFGGTQTYIPTSSYVSGSSCTAICGLTMSVGSSLRWDGQTRTTLNTLYAAYAPFNLTSSTTTGTQEAVSNMNFTAGSSNWAFVTQSSNLVGGYNPIQGNPIPGSGVGSLFLGATYSSGSTFTSNFTTRFFNDPTNLGTYTSAQFSWARYVPAHSFTNSKVSTFTINIYLIDENTAPKSTYTIATITYSSGDNSFVYTTGVTSLTNGTSIVSRLSHTGYYDIVVSTSTTFPTTPCGASCIQFLAYFDDVGLIYGFNSYVTDWFYTYQTSQLPTNVESLSVSVSTAYNQSNVIQQVYLFDYSSSKYDLFSDVTVSKGTTTVAFTVGITNTGEYSAQNYLSLGGKLQLRVFSTLPTTKAVGGHMETDIQTSNSLSVTVSFASTSTFNFSVENNGPLQTELVSLIITDSSGHHYYNSTTSPSFDVVLFSQQSLTISFNYNWIPGVTTLVVLTARGNTYSMSGSSS